MGLAEFVVAGLASLCLNSSCIDDAVSERIPWSPSSLEKLRNDLKNETFIVTTLQNGGLSGYTFNGTTIEGTGVAFDIFNIIQKEYGFKYVLKPPNDNVFEARNGESGGVKKMLLDGEADVTVAFLPEMYNEEIQYSRSLDTAQWVVLMKRPTESATGTGLLAPFTATVWSLIIVSVLGVGPVLWLIMVLRAKMCKDNNDIVFSLPSCMWFVYGALLKQGSTLSPRTDSSRILFSTWWIFITILTAFYTANLTAFLTLSKFTLPISEPKDISQKRYTWVTNRGNGIVEQLENSKKMGRKSSDGILTLYGEIGTPREQLDVADEEILTEYVTKRNHMYIREKTLLETIMYDDYKLKAKNNVAELQRCTYVITTFPVCVFPRSFAFRPGFKYKRLFDWIIQYLSESGITEFKQREFLPDTTICPLNLGNNERKLRNSDLIMTYMIVGGGLVIATLIFGIELLQHYAKCFKKPSVLIGDPRRSRRWFQTRLDNKDEALPAFITPPPSYHTLFGHPPVLPGTEYKQKIINGRQYWVVNNKQGVTSLIPQRTPSALLFQYTN